jgi:hypothetical protein
MRPSSQIRYDHFIVQVRFFSGDLYFGSETYQLQAAHWYAAEQQGLQMSLASVYDNERIPELRRTASTRQP